ncbi:CCR4-NOT transcription complex subunit 6 [Acromyrmex echinatior]|uniref:CCR4-NOT transcription complex subunit 6 n=1 Tax=Acromyrmex echinatior TaxID=103372 RepID=F4X6S7_ACREC|nr:CCR4-NOT transcription complex subunit 6 [Acromyrmex echinatior]
MNTGHNNDKWNIKFCLEQRNPINIDVHRLQDEYHFAHSIQQRNMLLAYKPKPSFINITPSHLFPSLSVPMIEPAPGPSSSQLHNSQLLEVVQVTKSNKNNFENVKKNKPNWTKNNKLKLLKFVAKPHNITRKLNVDATEFKMSRNHKEKYENSNPRRMYTLMCPEDYQSGKKSHWSELEITGSIRNLSPNLWQMTHLTALYLNDNSLQRLPSEIGRLVSLRILDLSSNKLRSLPAETEIGHVSSQSDPLLVFPCSHRAGPTGYVLVLSRVPSTRLVHFLPRAPDPRATHWAPPPPPPPPSPPPPRILSSLGLSLTRSSKPAVKSFRERRITTSSFPLASYRRALKAADVRG